MNQTSDLDDLLAEDLADPEGRALYEEIGAMVEFGIALALAREARKMSIKTLATATELPYTTIRDIEKGNIAPTLLMQMKLAHALKARTEIADTGRIQFVLFPLPVHRRPHAHVGTKNALFVAPRTDR